MTKKAFYLLAFILGFNLFLIPRGYPQALDSVPKRNVALLASVSVLDGSGSRLALPGFYYGSRRHAFSVAPACKLGGNTSFAIGLSAGYFYFLEPSFRDITFFASYNVTGFFEKNGALTHIAGFGTQIDIGKRGFLQHSVGLGIQQATEGFYSLGAAGQLKLTLGLYLKEIPVVHIHDDWEP